MFGSIITALNFLGDLFPDQKEQLIDATKNVAKDKIEGIITGKRTIDEWAEIAIKSVDKIKQQKVIEEDLQYVGGRLCFQISDMNKKNVIISFQLYFLDEDNEVKKVEATSDVLSDNFTPEALEELKSQGKIEFDVKG